MSVSLSEAKARLLQLIAQALIEGYEIVTTSRYGVAVLDPTVMIWTPGQQRS